MNPFGRSARPPTGVDHGPALIAELGRLADAVAALAADAERRAAANRLLPGEDTRPCPGCGKRDSVLREHITEDVYGEGGAGRTLFRGAVRLCIRCGETYGTNAAGTFAIHPRALGQAPAAAPDEPRRPPGEPEPPREYLQRPEP